MDNLEELRAATASLEQSSGYTLFDTPLPLSPPLAPTTTPVTSPPPAPLVPAPAPSPPFPSPAQLQPAPRPRTTHFWSPAEVREVVALYGELGKKFRRIARLTLRSEGAVRGILVRRGVLPPPKKRVTPAVPQERWTAEEDQALLAAIETTPRHERGGFRWKAIARRAGLKRPAHAARNRAGRLALEGAVSE